MCRLVCACTIYIFLDRPFIYSQTGLKGVTHGKDRKWLLKTGDPLIQVHLHFILVQGTEKRWLLKTGDPLIAMTT